MKLSGDDTVRYFTYVEDSVGGPYTIEALESLVYLKKITPDTHVARVGAEAFVLLRDSKLSPILFPGLLTKQDSTPRNGVRPARRTIRRRSTGSASGRPRPSLRM